MSGLLNCPNCGCELPKGKVHLVHSEACRSGLTFCGKYTDIVRSSHQKTAVDCKRCLVSEELYARKKAPCETTDPSVAQ